MDYININWAWLPQTDQYEVWVDGNPPVIISGLDYYHARNVCRNCGPARVMELAVERKLAEAVHQTLLDEGAKP